MANHSPITIAHFWTKVRAPSDFQCWTWEGRKNEAGYGRFDGLQTAHRWSYEFFNGPIPDGLFILHSCDNPSCVNPKHLRAGTHADNMRDAVERKRLRTAERHPRTKLTFDQVEYIRRNPDGLTQKQLAAKFGIATSTTSYIRSGRSWRYHPR